MVMQVVTRRLFSVTKSQKEAKEAEEEEKMTNSMKVEFQVSFSDWVPDTQKI